MKHIFQTEELDEFFTCKIPVNKSSYESNDSEGLASLKTNQNITFHYVHKANASSRLKVKIRPPYFVSKKKT